MENNEFDKVAVRALSYDPGEPNESVWLAIEAQVHCDRLPSLRETVLSGFVSAAVLLVAWLAVRSELSSTPQSLKSSKAASVFREAIRDDAKLTLIAISKIEGM